jgi:predicted 2-oxoglutarate/Fe(II)-dependent dioxygenase YbiX/peroxiredoxin
VNRTLPCARYRGTMRRMNRTAAATQDFRIFDVGDRLRVFGFRDHTGQQVTLDNLTLAGKPVVLFICPPGVSDAKALFSSFAATAPELFKLGASLLVIGGHTLEAIDGFFGGVPTPFPVLADPQGQIPDFLGLGKLIEPMTLIAGPDLRVRRIISGSGQRHAEEAVAFCAILCQPIEYRPVLRQAPVLLIENVLSPEQCARIITFWDSQQKHYGIVGTAKGGVQTYDTTIKRRWDVAVEDPGLRAELESIIQRRVLSEIKKACHFAVRTGETMKIGCYDAEQQGFFQAHRDNNDPQVAHRRFAMSLNLNDGYEGCGVRFPEFPGSEYRPPAGAALVFSCSLLHEVLPVTKGRRFAIFGFYW